MDRWLCFALWPVLDLQLRSVPSVVNQDVVGGTDGSSGRPFNVGILGKFPFQHVLCLKRSHCDTVVTIPQGSVLPTSDSLQFEILKGHIKEYSYANLNYASQAHIIQYMIKNLTNRLQASWVFPFQFDSAQQCQLCCAEIKLKRSVIIQKYTDFHWNPPHGWSCLFSQRSEGLLLFSWSYCVSWYKAVVSHWERWHLSSSLWVEPAAGSQQVPETAFELGENDPSIF